MAGRPDIEGGTWSHVVQIYGDDAALARSVADYLAEGLTDGETAIVVATEPHARAFEAGLRTAGIDTDEALRSAQLQVIDAERTLARLMAGDAPDTSTFDAMLAEPIRLAQARGPVRVYGELVDLLWGDGLVRAAMELEALWDGLGRQVPFSLFCAYHADPAGGDEAHAEIADLCHLHTAVVGAGAPRPTASARRGIAVAETARPFERSTEAPRAARQFVMTTLEAWGCADLGDDGALVVTELATNAVLHARTDFSVTLTRWRSGAVHISVADGSPTLPAPGEPAPTSPTGRGLQLVGATSARWGTELPGDGKVVWAELHP